MYTSLSININLVDNSKIEIRLLSRCPIEQSMSRFISVSLYENALILSVNSGLKLQTIARITAVMDTIREKTLIPVISQHELS
jgi:hypothetical protein